VTNYGRIIGQIYNWWAFWNSSNSVTTRLETSRISVSQPRHETNKRLDTMRSRHRFIGPRDKCVAFDWLQSWNCIWSIQDLCQATPEPLLLPQIAKVIVNDSLAPWLPLHLSDPNLYDAWTWNMAESWCSGHMPRA